MAIDNHLSDLEFVKFYLLDVNTDRPSVYFMNTVTHRAHMRFANAVGIPAARGAQSGQMRGEIVYHRNVRAPDGTLGVYRFEFEPNDSYSFPAVRLGYELLASSMPFLTNNFLYYPMPQAALPLYQRERAQYDAYRMRIVLEGDLGRRRRLPVAQPGGRLRAVAGHDARRATQLARCRDLRSAAERDASGCRRHHHRRRRRRCRTSISARCRTACPTRTCATRSRIRTSQHSSAAT